jgi:hypothetical protein
MHSSSDKEEVLPLNALIVAIQNARRILAHEEEGVTIDETDLPSAGHRADKQKKLELDNRIDQIQDALENFKPPSRT